MSIIAGFSFFSGVCLVADCRATVLRPGQPDIHSDDVQKIFPLAPHTALGFVGDITTAAYVLEPLWYALKLRKNAGRTTAVGVLGWIPRYLRFRYAQLSPKRTGPLGIMVASVIPGRPNRIERAKVVALLERFRLGKLSHQRSWLPDILVRILQTPTAYSSIALTDAPTGLLYVMEAPDFIPKFFGPLESAAIGSGEGALSQFELESDWIFAGDVGNAFVETMAVQTSVASYVHSTGLTSVGGLFPCIRVTAPGVSAQGFSAEIPIGGEKIELKPLATGRWEQHHHNSGTRIELRLPWEFDFRTVRKDRKFDYLRDADTSFAGGRPA
jgi:hypothetical protein